MDKRISGPNRFKRHKKRREIGGGGQSVFHILYSTLEDVVTFNKMQCVLRSDLIVKPAGHATVFSVEEEHLAARLKDLSGRCFIFTPHLIHRAGFVC